MTLKYVVICFMFSLSISGSTNDTAFVLPASHLKGLIKTLTEILGSFPISSEIVSEVWSHSLQSLSHEHGVIADKSQICIQKLINLTNALVYKNNSNMLEESISFFDALGKPPSGILRGNLLLLGSYDSCLQTKSSTNGYYKPCKISASVKIGKINSPITWTTCFPDECRTGNFTALKTILLSAINKHTVVNISEESVHTTCQNHIPYDIGSYIAITLISLISFLIIVGTLWDPVLWLYYSIDLTGDKTLLVNSEYTSEEVTADPIDASDDIVRDTSAQQHSQETSVFGRIFKCFSIQRTFGALFSTDTKPGQVLCLNGIRVISINWVVLGHVYYIGIKYPDLTPYKQIYSRISFSTIYNAFPAVDTFFFISGFLVSLLLLKDLHRRKGSFNALGYYIHRYLRLTIPYLMVILIQGFLYPAWITGPFSDIFSLDLYTCRKWWWTNILYINNLVPWNKVELCIGQSWYLSNDFQFFVIAPIFIIALYRKPSVGVLLICLSLAASAATAGVLTAVNNFGPTVVFDGNGTNMTDFRTIYDKPWTRIPPYLVGVLGGWVYWAYFTRIQLHVQLLHPIKKLLFGGSIWAVTCGLQYAVVYGLHHDMLNKLEGKVHANKLESVTYETCARTGWALTLMIQIFACQCGLGGVINTVLSWRGWLVMSRLTFAVYLLHYGIIQALVAQLRHPFYFAPDFEVAVTYLGCLAISYGAGVLLYIAVEQPLAGLERITYRKTQ